MAPFSKNELLATTGRNRYWPPPKTCDDEVKKCRVYNLELQAQENLTATQLPIFSASMERLKTWAHPSSSEGTVVGTTDYRPPPLRTVGTYDDDEFFNNVALNMLSRYEALSLSASEAICSTLVSPKTRASFLEGLHTRLARASSMSPSARSLIQNTTKVFGQELRRIVESESPCSSYGKQSPCFDRNLPPATPRHVLRGPNSVTCSLPSTTGADKKKKKVRRFFPDCDSKSVGGGFFRTRKVQNIDWKLAEAIQQVHTLSLDGDNTREQRKACYQPPQMC